MCGRHLQPPKNYIVYIIVVPVFILLSFRCGRPICPFFDYCHVVLSHVAWWGPKVVFGRVDAVCY